MVEYNPRYLWQVPPEDEGAHGNLLSDRIRFYVDAAHLIEPETFKEDGLRAASYDLHVGETYYVCEDSKDTPKALDQDEQLQIPANGLVYIATAEHFNIPYYLIARYSLQVTQVYRGLLIDNGLQVDPGYHGRIFIPVHNFTDEPRSLVRGEPFLSMDFAYTSPLPRELGRADTERELIALARNGRLKGVDGRPIILFTLDASKIGKERTPAHFWGKRPGEVHKSSLLGMEERNNAFRKEVEKTIGRGKLTISIAAIGLILSLFGIIFPWISRRYLDTQLAVQPIKERVDQIDRRLSARPELEIKHLEQRVNELQGEVNGLKQRKSGSLGSLPSPRRK